MSEALLAFAPRLIAWQAAHGRHDLPWQRTRDAYSVWLSEIMLQQTQVTSVIGYYQRFLARFPTLADLARAPAEDVLEAWAGLGYYARARNLHRCAQIVAARPGGDFPPDPKSLADLPGIGRSTAAAIAVFAFGARAAILDGNVKRVLARCFAVDGFPGEKAVESALWRLAETLLPESSVEAYTQGLMDLGATVCTRARPACAACPVHAICLAREQGRQAELPVARPRKALPERRTTFLVLCDGESVLVERRPASGIWGGLLSLPELIDDGESVQANETSETSEMNETSGANEADASAIDRLARKHGCRATVRHALPTITHTFTHFRLHISPIYCRVERKTHAVSEAGWHWLALDGVDAAALPTPVARLLSAIATTSYD